ncbi:MAG: hypothetical protein P8X47_07420 [Ignavibacteriaceae bacterium]
MKRLSKIIAILGLFLLSNCGVKQMKFDRQKWNKESDGSYEYRENMVNDLIENHVRKGMTYKQLIDLIGKPGNYGNLDNNTVAYGIMEDYGWDIDPVETKTLMIELTKDSLVKNYKVEAWKK